MHSAARCCRLLCLRPPRRLRPVPQESDKCPDAKTSSDFCETLHTGANVKNMSVANEPENVYIIEGPLVFWKGSSQATASQVTSQDSYLVNHWNPLDPTAASHHLDTNKI